MPCLKPIEYTLPYILRMNAIDLLMYAHVTALMQALPGIMLKEAFYHFQKCYGLTDDDITLKSFTVFISRINKMECKEMDVNRIFKTAENELQGMSK